MKWVILKLYMGEWLRGKCPVCGSRDGFAVHKSNDGYHCFSCGVKGRKSTLDLEGAKYITEYKDSRFPTRMPSRSAAELWESLPLSLRGGYTDKYLASRGVPFEAWEDIELREGIKGYDFYVAAYPFRELHGAVISLNYVTARVEKGSLIKVGKRYKGPKSQGVALLCDKEPIIIAEGLENALTVRMKFGTHCGLCVGGDASNIKKYATEHQAILAGRTFIYVEDGDAPGRKAAAHFKIQYRVDRTVACERLRDANDLWGRTE